MSSTSSSLRFYRAALQSCGYEPLRAPRLLMRRNALPSASFSSSSARAAAPASPPPPPPSKPSAPKITDKSRILSKPERYTPPSHPPRQRRSAKMHYYGGALSKEAKDEMDRKQYPHMMPPETSWSHWLLTSRALHTTITLSVLTTLAVVVYCLEFRRKSPYVDLLPSWAHFFRHPLDAWRQVWSVYVMDSHHHTQEAQARRDRDLDDARKRKAYRVAHGLENPTYGLQGAAEGLGDIKFGEKDIRDPKVAEEVEFERKVKLAYLESVEKAGGDPKAVEEWSERRKGRPIKKWLGIWGSE